MKQYLNIIGVFVCLAVVAVIAFYAGRNSADNNTDDLLAQLEAYQKAESDAAVVKRVSQQMEDIAYQQTEISDRQRDRAEEQSLLAIANAQRAEKESKAAREAENRAKSALEEAERQRAEAVQQRANAQQQEQFAREQLLQTQLQKSITDTLSFRTLGRSLGATSIAQYENNNNEQASLLAYSSWYFINKYKGNTYQTECFKALSLASDLNRRYTTSYNAAVGGTVKMDGAKDGCIVVTKFGGIEKWENVSTHAKHTLLYQNKNYDFRDVELESDGTIWALSRMGHLCHLVAEGKVVGYPLPSDLYFNIMKTADKTYMLVAQGSISWFDLAQGKVTRTIKLPGQLSTVCLKDRTLLMFYKSGAYSELSLNGTLTTKPSPIKGVVTAAFYDKGRNCCFYGTTEGNITVVSRYGIQVLLSAHSSSITDIDLDGDILLSSGYDKQVFIWNLQKLQLPSGRSFNDEMEARTSFVSTNTNIGISNEWLIPVDLKFDGWPLNISLDRDKDYLWVGTSNGTVQRMSYSVLVMSNLVKKSLKRNMTMEEWSSYVGVSVPYVKFK